MTRLNPAWTAYNAINNEGGEGFNPHPKFISAPAVAADPVAPVARSTGATRMIYGKARTQADAIKYATRCLSGAQREEFLAEVAAKFGA